MNNPYYSPDAFNLQMYTFDEPELSYEYNTLAFFATPNGYVYTVQDQGCSCPIPFEEYESENVKDLLHKLERVENVAHAISIVNGWHDYWRYRGGCDTTEFKQWLSVNGSQLM